MSYPKNKYERFLKGKRKAYERVSLFFSPNLHNKDKLEELVENCAKHYRDTTKRCSSCMCCGNPRKRGGLTIQERRFLSSLKD